MKQRLTVAAAAGSMMRQRGLSSVRSSRVRSRLHSCSGKKGPASLGKSSCGPAADWALLGVGRLGQCKLNTI